MDGKFDEVQLLFIERSLELHGEMITDLLRGQIEQKHLIKNEDLLDSIDFQVSKYGIDPVLLISFFAYGRFIEINWFKRSQNSRKLIANSNRLQWSMRENRKRTKKKDTRWYAKTAYGSINHLIAVLSNDFSDSERDYLKQLLELRYESKN
ncbi:MAG: hypothetical protein NTU51_10625 [Bacteroidetes bacterium]|nr:hypothetical protein [Bacteroidota bacterium]